MRTLSLPAIYALEITPSCNNHCPGCSNVYAAHHGGAAPLLAREWRNLLAPFIAEAVQIRLTGGEPTLHPEFSDILEEVTSHDAQVTVFTNGRWRDPEGFVHRLRGRRRFSGLLISLHGANATSHEAFSGVPGSFAETLANIKLALRAGITVALSMVLTRYSCNELDAVVELGRQLGVQHVAINRYIGPPLLEIEATEDQIAAAIVHVQDLAQVGAPVRYGVGIPQCFIQNDSEGCLAGVAYVSIDPWGNVRPCAHSPTVLGSLRERSLAELWRGPAMEAWRSLMPAACVTCAAYPACHGGCRAIQELRSDKRDPLRCSPLAEFAPPVATRELPATGRPRARLRLREEPFGYAVLGHGHVIPVRPEAHLLIEACTGGWTLAQLADRFGQAGLDLLGDLWKAGMLDIL